MQSILLVAKLLGLLEMTPGLVNASFSLPEWQAVKVIFFAVTSQFLSSNSVAVFSVVLHLVVSRKQHLKLNGALSFTKRCNHLWGTNGS